jgi:hypothetical protein
MRDVVGNARLVVVDSYEHTSYGTNDCATRIVDDYLVDPETSDPDALDGVVEC